MSTYSQGVCSDGAAILKNGEALSVDQIVAQLNADEASRRERLAAKAMTGIVQARIACKDNYNAESVAYEACEFADALINQLNINES